MTAGASFGRVWTFAALPLIGLLCLFFWAASAGIVSACSIPSQTLLGKLLFPEQDKRVVQAEDCTYINGGKYDSLSGAAVQDFGDGRIVQMILFDTYLTEALVVDCNSAEGMFVRGILDWENATSCGPEYAFSKHLAPHGVIDLNVGKDLNSMKAELSRHDVVVETASDYMSSNMKRRDRFDILCGCKIFYPGSKGADAAK